LINIYSDSLQLALKYLKDTEVDVHNVLVMTLQILYLWVYQLLLTMFLLDTQTIVKIQIQSSTWCSQDMDQKN